MTNEPQIERDPRVEFARQRLGETAVKLCQHLDPLDVAGAYVGIAATILAREIGRDHAAKYLQEMAAEIEKDTDPSWGGRA